MIKRTLRQRMTSFAFQMAAFYLTAGLLLLGLFGGVVYYVVSDIFVKEAIEKTELAIEKTAMEIGQQFSRSESLLTVLRATSDFNNYVMGDSAKEQPLLGQMQALANSDPNIAGVFAAFEDGRMVGAEATLLELQNVYASLLENDMPFLSTARSDAYAHNDNCVITLGIPVEETGKQLGVLALDLDYCMLQDTVSFLDLDGGIVYISDKNGQIIFPPQGQASIPTATPLGYDSKTNLLTQRFPIPDTNWYITGSAPLEGLVMLRKHLLDTLVFTGLLLFIALLAITVNVSRKLTTPISRLAGSMKDIESLKELSILSDEVSETRILTESYNQMLRKIKELMQQLEQKQIDLRQTEMEALTSQINPHFLYNTLDTIIWLAEFRDNDKIIALTKSLAAFFRLSLNGGKAVVPLCDELEHLQQYLFIQQERYGDKITYTFDVDPKLLDCLVPKIILQPLVENSIYHGIKPMDGIGHITIEGRQQGDTMILRVTDNGVGFNDTRSLGVGLKNVGQRIALYYGEGHGITVDTPPQGGTRVTILAKI